MNSLPQRDDAAWPLPADAGRRAAEPALRRLQPRGTDAPPGRAVRPRRRRQRRGRRLRRDRHLLGGQRPWSRVVVGVDWGYTNPSAVLLVCVDEQGALHVGDEFYRTGQLEPDVVRACQRFGSHAGAETFVVDPSAAALRATMERAGLCVVAGNNDVFGGITRVQKRLVLDGAGTPRLTVSPTCRHLIEELGVYEWMEGKDKPRKVHDHACDALRYAVMHLDEDRELEVRLLGGGGAGSGGGNWTAPTRAWWDDRPGIWRAVQ